MTKLLFVLILCVLATLGDSRGNIALGDSIGGILIYHETHEKYGIPLMHRTKEITVKGVGDELIKSVLIQDLKGDGISYITGGGVGRNNVTIKLESPKGKGYKFIVDVYTY